MKHTQGKWDVAKIISGDAVVYHSLIRADKKRSIATILQNSNAKANANLIASAPEMYELLKRLSEDWEVDFKHQYDMIAVLAKAEGK
ncbi:hypothetical protein [uncultured Mediterranean phage uvDeep-CGR2-KM18-C269]|nr:hypothetical protein [uncultured Mediterranean phage uvDeep-CGR2-KM18-C269]